MSFELVFFGFPEVVRAGQPLEFDRRQPLALLTYLALAEGPVSRDRLAFLLWADIPQAQARQRLRRVLHQLRAALEIEKSAPILEVTSETLSLCRKVCRVDVWEFLRHAQATQEGNPAEVARSAEQAIALYRSPFMDGFFLREAPEFEQWMKEQRDYLHQMYLRAWRTLTLARMAQGQPSAAIAAAEGWLEADPLAEEAYRLLMVLHAESGQNAEAIRLYRRCVETLRQELGVEPEPQTCALYDAIRCGSFCQTAKISSSNRLQEARAIAWRLRPTLEVPCVGREAEIARVRKAVQSSLEGRPQVMCLCGPPGIGKTRLIQEALAGFAQPIWLGSGRHAGRLIPYGTILEVLNGALEGVDPAQLPLEEPWRQEAARLLPLLRPPVWHPMPDLPPEQAQARLFEALVQLVQALVRQVGAAILVGDDLEEADPASLACLRALAMRLHGLPLAMVLIYQEEQANPVLQACLTELTRLGLKHEIPLSPLTEEAVQRLVGHVAPSLSAAELAPYLWEASGGLPFLALEGLRALLEAGEVYYHSAALLPMTADATASLRARLERLDSVTRQVLEACAVLQENLYPLLIRQVAGRGALEVADALDVLTARSFLRPEAEQYRFAHGFMACVAYEAIGPERRRLLHRRAAVALRRHNPDRLTTFAEHLERSDRPQEAIPWWLKAGDRAWSLFTAAEALAAWSRGLALRPSPALQFELLARQEEVLHRLGRREEQTVVLAQMEALVQELSPEQQALAASRRGRHALALNRWAEAEQHLRAALAMPIGDLAARAELRLLLVNSLTSMHRYEEAEALAQEVLQEAADANMTGLQAQALIALGEIAQAREDLTTAEARVREALGLPLDMSLRARVTQYLARLSYLSGQYDVALAYGAEALQAYERQVDQEGQARSWTMLALPLARLRRYGEAMSAYTQARTIYRSIQNPQGLAASTINAATLALRMGDFERGLSLTHEAYILFKEIQDGRGLCVAAANIGAALVWLGRGKEAEPWLREDVERARALNLLLQEAAGLANLGAALLQQGRIAEACTEMECGLALRQRLGPHVDTCGDKAMLALGYLLGDELSQAERLSREAVEGLHAHPGVEHPQFILFAYAQVLHALGHPDAETLLREAAAALEQELDRLPKPEDQARYLNAFRFNAVIRETLATGRWPDPPFVV